MDSARMIQAPDGDLYLREWQSQAARPLLLVHGMAGNTHWWDYAAPLLSRGFKPAALDLSGHGDSQWRKNGEYSASGFVADMERARAALGWERMFLCGHSFGARMALDYAAQYPGRLLGLVCADFMPEYEPPNPRKKSFRARLKPRQPIYKEKEQILARFHLQPPGSAMSPERMRALAETCARRVEAGYTWKTDWRVFTFRYESARPVFPKIAVPCLVIRGEFSSVMEPQDFDEAVKAISGARGLQIPGSYHHVPLDRPEEFAQGVLEFAASLAARADSA